MCLVLQLFRRGSEAPAEPKSTHGLMCLQLVGSGKQIKAEVEALTGKIADCTRERPAGVGGCSTQKIRARRGPRRTRHWKPCPAGAHLRTSLSLLIPVSILLSCVCLQAEQRFPPPDFEGGYQIPATATPAARALWF